MRLSTFQMILLMTIMAVWSGCNTSSDKRSTDNPSYEKAIIDPWAADSIAYRRWGSPASPYRDEGRYISFLDSFLVRDDLPEELRERAEYRKRIAMLNRPGSIAADFRYLERHGKTALLHELESPLTLLVFYDPECPHCSDILRAIASSKTINSAIAEKELTVIAVYAEGKREVWDNTRYDLPDNWLVGYDLTGILDKELYNLPAMPTPYLLNSGKEVILKDPELKTLIVRIANMSEIHNPTQSTTYLRHL